MSRPTDADRRDRRSRLRRLRRRFLPTLQALEGRQLLAYSQDFATTAIGALPAGWVNDADASVQANGFESSPNALATVPDASSAHWAYYDTPDDGGGNNTYVAWMEFNGQSDSADLVYRLTPGDGIAVRTDYEFFAQPSAGGTGQVALERLNDGTLTTLEQMSGAALPFDTPLRFTVVADGDHHQCEIYRGDTGQYYTPSGTWSSTQQYCIDVTDTSPSAIAGAGRTGLLWSDTSSSPILFDDFSTTPLPATVLDAGFESPSVSTAPGGFEYAPTGTSWSYSDDAGVSGNDSAFTFGNPNAPEGTQVGFLQWTGAFSQSVALAAGSYELSFDAAQRGGDQASEQDFQVLVDGNLIGTFTPAGTSYVLDTTASFPVAAGPHTITFQGLDSAGGDNTAFIDDVGLTQVSSPSLSDAGFESPSVSTAPGGFEYAPTGTSWSYSDDAGVSGNDSAFTYGNPNAPEGTQVGFLQLTGAFSQSVALAAGSYELSFDAAQRGGDQASEQDFQVLVDGNLIGTFTPAGTSYALDTTASFTVAAGAYTITFQGLDSAGGDNTAFIDDVGLTQVSSPSLSDTGFESPSVSTAPGGFEYAPTGTSWSYSDDAGVSGNDSAFTYGNPNAPEGTQVGFLQLTGAFSQSVALAAGSYELSFDAAQRGGDQASQQDFQVLLDSTVIGTFTPTGSTYALYTIAEFPVTAGSHTITFQGLDSAGGNNTAFVDDVQLTQETAGPSVATPAAATPSPVTGTTAALSVLGADPNDNASDLTYAWTTISAPSGATAPVFSINGNNAAQQTTATFYRAGSYTFQVMISNPSDLSVTSSVTVTVAQTLTTIAVSPDPAVVIDTANQSFTASASDQFGQPLASPPAFTWSVVSGGAGGTIATNGTYTAPASGTGSDTVQATSGGVSGTAAVTLDNPPAVSSVTPIQTNAGSQFTGILATFTENLSSALIGELTANIVWGDGTPSTTVTPTFPGGILTVSGSHTYAAAGTDSFVVRIVWHSQVIVTAPGSASVAAPSTAITGQVEAISLLQDQEYSGPVATFTSGNPNAQAGQFTATIDWGDGSGADSTADLEIEPLGDGTFQIVGSHTYQASGSYSLSVTISDDGNTLTASGSASVAAPPFAATGLVVNATPWVELDAEIAYFTYVDPNATASDFTATISGSAGDIRPTGINNQFAVFYSSIWNYSGQYDVRIDGPGGIYEVTSATVNVEGGGVGVNAEFYQNAGPSVYVTDPTYGTHTLTWNGSSWSTVFSADYPGYEFNGHSGYPPVDGVAVHYSLSPLSGSPQDTFWTFHVNYVVASNGAPMASSPSDPPNAFYCVLAAGVQKLSARYWVGWEAGRHRVANGSARGSYGSLAGEEAPVGRWRNLRRVIAPRPPRRGGAGPRGALGR